MAWTIILPEVITLGTLFDQSGNEVVPADSVEITVVITEEPSANYRVLALASWNTTIGYKNKTTTQFDLEFGTPPSVESQLAWAITS